MTKLGLDLTFCPPVLVVLVLGGMLACRTLVFRISAPYSVQDMRVDEFGMLLGSWHTDNPIEIEITDTDGVTKVLSAPYQLVTEDGRAEGFVISPGGSRFKVTDVFKFEANGFVVSRTVRVAAASPSERGFSSRFSMTTSDISHRRKVFIPAAVYPHPDDTVLDNDYANNVLVGEDRLPLPLVSTFDPDQQRMMTLIHLRPDNDPFINASIGSTLVDSSMRIGSLGVVTTNLSHSIVFEFPGAESKQLFFFPREGWENRRHPLQTGFSHSYELLFMLDTAQSIPEVVQASWRRAMAEAPPWPGRVDLDDVYDASMNALAHYSKRYNGVPSVPFLVSMPSGEMMDASSQMGFTGKALPAAALLLRDALDRGNRSRQKAAEDIIDFWVDYSMEPSGVPKVWYNVPRKLQRIGHERVWWRKKPTYLRTASDGLRAVVAAWRLIRKPTWIAFARRFGDFLTTAQQSDGSFPMAWEWNGSVADHSRIGTHNAIPFLGDLYAATGDERYKTAALRAGDFCLLTIHAEYRYVGGAVDKPNVTDRESGALAMQAFLALWRLTGDKKWIGPASQAGTFAETWLYAWNVPRSDKNQKSFTSRDRTTVGASIIRVGTSTTDPFMAITVYDYFLLYKLTGDRHFLNYACFLMHASRQSVDFDGSFGYGVRGLLPETMNPLAEEEFGKFVWLPWLTVAILEPMVRLLDEFGSYDIETISDRTDALSWRLLKHRTQ
eukprot:TRINITY_DN68149_c0_g1_i1.p1 TRINITY_DN68149_c0_g1~~TRINITY_DN68149_c0_g1_i1.p1  ORF type:complete len:722 (-),score=94.70 TRINITY_DN68149_c0_g1_i1:16-2181(-)